MTALEPLSDVAPVTNSGAVVRLMVVAVTATEPTEPPGMLTVAAVALTTRPPVIFRARLKVTFPLVLMVRVPAPEAVPVMDTTPPVIVVVPETEPSVTVDEDVEPVVSTAVVDVRLLMLIGLETVVSMPSIVADVAVIPLVKVSESPPLPRVSVPPMANAAALVTLVVLPRKLIEPAPPDPVTEVA